MASKESWNYTALRIANEIKLLDKKPETAFKINDPVIKACIEDLKGFNIERSHICRDLRSKIFALKTDLDEVKATLLGKSTKLSDGSILRFILEEFEMKLTTLKVHNKAASQDIDSQTEQVAKEVDDMTKIIDTWLKEEEDNEDDTNNNAKQESPVNTTEQVKKNLEHQRRLGVIEKQIISLGGIHGGWHFRDHDVFLRVWVQTQTQPLINGSAAVTASVGENQNIESTDNDIVTSTSTNKTVIKDANDSNMNDNNNHSHQLPLVPSSSSSSSSSMTPFFNQTIPSSQKLKIIRKLSPLLSHKTPQECEEHIDWYLMYLSLHQAKKALLTNWKESKYHHHHHHHHNNNNNNNLNGVNDDENNNNGDDDKDDENINTLFGNDNNDHSNEKLTPEERLAMKQRIQTWKLQQEEKIQQQKSQEIQQQMMTKKQEEEKRRLRQQDVKIQIATWKEIQTKEELELQEIEQQLNGGGGGSSARSGNNQNIKENNAIEIKKRQKQDAEIALKRKLILSRVYQQQKQTKADRVAELYHEQSDEINAIIFGTNGTITGESGGSGKIIKRDPMRLLNGTTTSRNARLTSMDLEEAEIKRSTANAHSKYIPMNGRDLKFTGRMTPNWMKPVHSSGREQHYNKMAYGKLNHLDCYTDLDPNSHLKISLKNSSLLDVKNQIWFIVT